MTATPLCDGAVRVTYWTGIWEPHREAISGQVATVRSHLSPGAPVVAFSATHQPSLSMQSKVVRLNRRQWPLLRLLAPLVERAGAVTHIFGELSAWSLLRAVGTRPVVFTVVIGNAPLDLAVYDRVRIFVAECPRVARMLCDMGVPPERVRVIYPGVDLARFNPAAGPGPSFSVLFASSPSNPEDFGRRGIPLIVDAARLCPDIRFVLLWRTWGNGNDLERAFQRLCPPPNVIVDRRDVVEMAGVYPRFHATLFLPKGTSSKAAPNSVIEGLACGVPAIVSEDCGIAELIDESGAGAVVPSEPHAVAAALRDIQRAPCGYRVRARELAESAFSLERFVDNYRKVYREVLNAN